MAEEERREGGGRKEWLEGGAKVDRARVNNFALERLCQAWMENVRFFFFSLY